MDLDAFVTEHRGEWNRLRQLAGRPKRRLTAAEVDEMVALYHRAATHLSVVRSRSPDPALVAWLSRLVLQARAAAHARRPGSRWAAVGPLLRRLVPRGGLPGPVVGWPLRRRLRLLAGVLIAIVADDPERRFVSPARSRSWSTTPSRRTTPRTRRRTSPLLVWTNNAWIAAICLAGGVLILPVLFVLWDNMENIGIVGGVMVGNGRADIFFGLILVHGLLELTSSSSRPGWGCASAGRGSRPART